MHKTPPPQHVNATGRYTINIGTVYEAEIVEVGRMHVLQSNNGKVRCGISITICNLVLSLGLAFGLPYGRDKSNGDT